MLNIDIKDDIHLEELNHTHARAIFGLINSNREYLRKWLTFVDETKDIEDTEHYIDIINASVNKPNGEIIIVIRYNKTVVGIIGLKKVDWTNRIAEIGYWLDKNFQGKGIITRSCNAIINYAFSKVGINRVEIKCGVGNKKSGHIAQRLGFRIEGIEREGEFVNGRFIDMEVYSLLKREWVKNNLFVINNVISNPQTDFQRLSHHKIARGNNFSQS